jgi:hypothetical protein
MKLFEILRSRVNERRMSALETLVAAANRVAADESVDHAAVESALHEAGRSVDDFENMVELARKRRAWRADHDKGKPANTRLAKAQATAERERAQFETIRAAWMARATELDNEIRAAQKLVDAANSAAYELVRPDNVPGAPGEQLRVAHDELAQCSSEVARCSRGVRHETELEKTQLAFAAEKESLNQSTPYGDAADHKRRAASAARRKAEWAEQLKTAEAAERDAAARLQQAEAAAMKV